jgi:hypothetical protein
MKSFGYFHDSAILNREKSHQGPLNRGLEGPHSRLKRFSEQINSLNAELNPIYHLLALLGAHHILHVSRIRVNSIVPANEARCSIPQPSRYNECLISAPKH